MVAVRVTPKDLRTFEEALLNGYWTYVLGWLLLIGLAGLFVYLSGCCVGILSLITIFLTTILVAVRWEKMPEVLHPYELSFYGYRPYKKVREKSYFYRASLEYMQRACSEVKPWWGGLLSGAFIALMTVLFPGGVEPAGLRACALLSVFCSFLGTWAGCTSFVYIKAKNPHRLSEFFGIPLVQWKTEEMVVRKIIKRIPIVTGLALLFLIAGVVVFSYGIIVIVNKLVWPKLPLPLFYFDKSVGDVLAVGTSYMLMGGAGILSGKWLWYMTKSGAVTAAVTTLFPLFIGCLFILFPGPPRICGGLLIAASILVFLLLKKEWRKFR
jgi:hypothetical protein